MNKTRITIESVARLGFKEDLALYNMGIKEVYPNFVLLVTEDKRFELRKTDNNIHYEYGWNLHVDNRDMETIASCDVEYVEQVETIMNLYKDY